MNVPALCKSNFFLAILFGTILFVPMRTIAADKSAVDIINRVQKTVKNLKTLSCSFEQEHYTKTVDRTNTIAGTIRMKIPTMLRVEYPAQTIVVDGKSVWWYIPKNQQVTVQAFEEGEETFPTPYGILMKYIATDESNETAVVDGESKIDGRICYILQLGKKGDSSITVWIDRDLNFPVRSVEDRANGDRTINVLKDIKLNGKLDSDLFTFDVPDSVTVVDMR